MTEVNREGYTAPSQRAPVPRPPAPPRDETAEWLDLLRRLGIDPEARP